MLGAIQKVENDLNAIKTLGEIHSLQHQLGKIIVSGGIEIDTDVIFNNLTADLVSIGEALIDTIKLWLPLDVSASAGSGYGLNHLINKDKEQTNLRTSLTIAGGAISGTAISSGSSYLYLKSKLKDLGYDSDVSSDLSDLSLPNMEEYRVLRDTAKTIDHLVDQMLEQIEKGENLGINDPTKLKIVKRGLNVVDSFFRLGRIMYYTSLTVSTANAYHGYKRNGGGGKGVGFGLLWFLFGGSTGLGVALSQGYGKEI